MEGYAMHASYDHGEERWKIDFHGGTSEMPTHGPTLVVKEKGNTEFVRNFVIALVDLYNEVNKPMFDPDDFRKGPTPEVQGPDPHITWRDWLAYFRYNYEWQMSEYRPDMVMMTPRGAEEPWEEEQEVNYRKAEADMIRLRKSKFHPDYYDPGRYDIEPETKDVTTALAAADGFLVDFDPEFVPPPVELRKPPPIARARGQRKPNRRIDESAAKDKVPSGEDQGIMPAVVSQPDTGADFSP